jgi:hypothetical protein
MLKSGRIAIIKEITGSKLTVELMNKMSLFNDPINSQSVGIHRVEFAGQTVTAGIEEVHCKMLVSKNSSVAIAFLNTIQ